jgi:hypothetical protein
MLGALDKQVKLAAKGPDLRSPGCAIAATTRRSSITSPT